MKENKKPSRKLGSTARCISRLNVTVYQSNEFDVDYLPLHTNHELSISEQAKHIPLPKSTKEEISEKLKAGIPVTRYT